MALQLVQTVQTVQTQWDFKIVKPLISNDDFGGDLSFHLRKMSNLVVVNRWEISTEDNRKVAKVRLGRSPRAEQQGVELHDGIKHLCKSVIDDPDGLGRLNLNCLTRYSIHGIEPLSVTFKTYWTASFITQALTNSNEMNNLIRESLEETSPYIAPTAIVFGFIVLGGLYDGIRFMQRLCHKDSTPPQELNKCIQGSFPTVKLLFAFFTKHEIAKANKGQKGEWKDLRSTHEFHRKNFRTKLDDVLDQFRNFEGETNIHNIEWVMTVCSRLHDMSLAGSMLLRGREPLLQALFVEREKELQGAIASGTTAVTATGFLAQLLIAVAEVAAAEAAVGSAATVVAPMVVPVLGVGSVAALSGFKAYKRIKNYRELERELKDLQIVFSAAGEAWRSGFRIHIVLERHRLDVGDDTSFMFAQSGKENQQIWTDIINEYRNNTRDGRRQGLPEIRLLSLFIEKEAVNMKMHRDKLE